MDNDSCDGCGGFRNKQSCQLIDDKKDKDCPCRVCLVRMMCTTDTCNEYKAYVSNTLSHILEGLVNYGK